MRMPAGVPAIRVEHLDKCYRTYPTPQARLRQFVQPRVGRWLGWPARQAFHEHWALRDVSFTVHAGETVGIVGVNGSGKSTLLQIIAGTLAPTAGVVHVWGRTAALLELGSGFNPEFTGRENVFLNAAVLGLTAAETAERFDEIAAFADIGVFIDQPVKTYSTGMVMRLAFAVSTCVRPDVLIIDEALAVGDAAFQAKCMLSMRQFQERGGTVFLVSHDVNAVRSLCQRALYLDHGVLLADGPSSRVCADYLRALQTAANLHLVELAAAEPVANVLAAAPRGAALPPQSVLNEFAERTAECRHGTGEARVLYADLVDEGGSILPSVAFGQFVRIRILVEGISACALSVNYRICNKQGIPVLGGDFLMQQRPLLAVEPGSVHWIEYGTQLPVLDGDYVLRISLTRPIDRHWQAVFAEIVEIAQVFSVRPPAYAKLWTAVHLPSTLSVSAASRESGVPRDREA